MKDIVNQNQISYVLGTVVIAIISWLLKTDVTNALIIYTGLILLSD